MLFTCVHEYLPRSPLLAEPWGPGPAGLHLLGFSVHPVPWYCSATICTVTRKSGQSAQAVGHLLEEPGDVLAAAAGPGERGRVVQELWRHDEMQFPNRLTVIAASVMMNAKTV